MDLLAALVAQPGIASHEEGVAGFLSETWAPFLDACRVDRLGSVIGLVQGRGPEPRPRLMAAAHMDTIGFMVRSVERGGFLRLAPVGGWDPRLLPGMEVEVHGRRRLRGVVGSRPPHVTPESERRRVMGWDDLFVDTGLPEAEVRELAPPGTPVTACGECVPLLGGRVAAGGLDDRAGLAALTLALAEVRRLSLPCDLYAVATVSEEFGGRPGAAAAAEAIGPDVAVAVDVTYGDQHGLTDDVFPLDGGLTLTIGYNAHPRLNRLLEEAAREAGVPLVPEVWPTDSGTDAWSIQVARAGVPCAVLSIPIRYMHSPVEVASLADVAAAGRLLARLAQRVDRALVEELSCF